MPDSYCQCLKVLIDYEKTHGVNPAKPNTKPLNKPSPSAHTECLCKDSIFCSIPILRSPLDLDHRPAMFLGDLTKDRSGTRGCNPITGSVNGKCWKQAACVWEELVGSVWQSSDLRSSLGLSWMSWLMLSTAWGRCH